MAAGDIFDQAEKAQKQDVFDQAAIPANIADAGTIGPSQPRSLMRRLGDWYMRKPAYQGTLDEPGRSPRDISAGLAKSTAFASIPALGYGLVAAPVATLAGLGGGLIGGKIGGYFGGKIGEDVGAPELGEDFGGLTGSIVGGGIGGRGVPWARSRIGASRMLAPIPNRTLGDVVESPTKLPAYGVRKLFPEPAERVAMRQPLQASLEERMSGVETARQKELADLGQLEKQADPLASAVREGRAMRIPTRMPKAKEPLPSKPELFPGATSSKTPAGSAEVPRFLGPKMGEPSIKMVEKFKPETEPKSRIIKPGEKPLRVEGSYWSFNESSLRRAVLSGDRDAAVVYKQRFGALPPNAGLLTDIGEGSTRGLYRSRKEQ